MNDLNMTQEMIEKVVSVVVEMANTGTAKEKQISMMLLSDPIKFKDWYVNVYLKCL